MAANYVVNNACKGCGAFSAVPLQMGWCSACVKRWDELVQACIAAIIGRNESECFSDAARMACLCADSAMDERSKRLKEST